MSNKDVAIRPIKEVDKHNPGIFRELCTEDARIYMPGRVEPHTVPEIIEMVSGYFEAFPDNKHTIDDVICEGDQVVVRGACRGTHKGEWMGVPPTGKQIEYGEIVIMRFKDGKITECWVQEDDLWMMQQLGMDLVARELAR